MFDKKMSMTLVGVLFTGFVIFSCSKEVSSQPNFIFKNSPDKTIAAKFEGATITNKDLSKGIESEIYEIEMKLYELKMSKLKSLILEKLMEAHPDKKNLTNDEFMDKHIAGSISVSEKEMEDFIKERQIPAEHINDQMKERIKNFLTVEKKKDAIETWLAKETAKKPVEIYLDRPERPVFKVKVTEASPSYGPKTAKVTLVEFSDFQCPFCAKGAEIIKQVKEKYADKVQIVFKNYPLPFHNDARGAANAGLCANEQGADKFWKLHDRMFKNQGGLSIEGLKDMGKAVGLDAKKFDECIDSNKYNSAIEADIKDGNDVGVKSTPTFFVNGKLVSGAVPFEQFVEIINAELK